MIPHNPSHANHLIWDIMLTQFRTEFCQSDSVEVLINPFGRLLAKSKAGFSRTRFEFLQNPCHVFDRSLELTHI